jgi:hypothetical protein
MKKDFFFPHIASATSSNRFSDAVQILTSVARACPVTARPKGVTKKAVNDKLKAPRARKFAWTGWRVTKAGTATATRASRLAVQESYVLRANSCLVGAAVHQGQDADAALAEAEAHLIGMGVMYYKYVRGVDTDADLSRFRTFSGKRMQTLNFNLGRDGARDEHHLVTSVPLFIDHRRANPEATYTLLWCLSLCVGSKRVLLYALRSDYLDQAVFPRMMHVEYPSGPSMGRAVLDLFLAPAM